MQMLQGTQISSPPSQLCRQSSFLRQSLGLSACAGVLPSAACQCAMGGGAARGGESQSSRPALTTRGCQCLGFAPHSQPRKKPPAKKPTFWLWWLRLRLLLLLFKLFLPFGFQDWVFILCLPVDVAGKKGKQFSGRKYSFQQLKAEKALQLEGSNTEGLAWICREEAINTVSLTGCLCALRTRVSVGNASYQKFLANVLRQIVFLFMQQKFLV